MVEQVAVLFNVHSISVFSFLRTPLCFIVKHFGFTCAIEKQLLIYLHCGILELTFCHLQG